MRTFIYNFLLVISFWSCTGQKAQKAYQVMTVNGLIDSGEMGITLEHEHITTDFIGAEQVKQPQYPVSQAVEFMLPFMNELKETGVATLIECTPEYIGRDVLLLKSLSQKSGINIITNTGYYAAADKKYLPSHAYTETAYQLADRWTNEWENGINGTEIKPGFIKLGVGKNSLDSIEQKLVKAGALTHLKSGLKIAIHTGSSIAAVDEINILKNNGVDSRALIVIHTQNCTSPEQIKLIKSGCWISLDGISQNPESIEQYSNFLIAIKQENLLGKVLISHDNGWSVIQNGDGTIGFELFGNKNEKPYSAIFSLLIPALTAKGFTQEDFDQLLVKNPAEAFKIEICTL